MKQQQLLLRLVIHLLAGLIQNVKWLEIVQLVHVLKMQSVLHLIVDLNALSTQNVQVNMHVSIKNVLIHVLDRVELTANVELLIIFLSVTVNKVIKAILLLHVNQYQFLTAQFQKIYVIHHHVEATLVVKMEFVAVCQNISEIHIPVVDLNVF